MESAVTLLRGIVYPIIYNDIFMLYL